MLSNDSASDSDSLKPYCEKGVVRAQKDMNGIGLFALRAEHVRRAATGPHASVTVALNHVDIADNLFNVLRGEERDKLARRTFKRLNVEQQKALPLYVIEAALDRFCKSVWPVWATGSVEITEAGYDDEPPDPTFALHPYVIDGGGSIIFAGPGAGKSYILYLMLLAMMHGLTEPWPCEWRMPLLINLERGADLVNRRIYYASKALGLNPTTRLRTIHARGRSLENVYDKIANAVQSDGYDVIGLDSISRTDVGKGNLKDDDTANQIINILSSLCPTWIALAHTSWAGASAEGRADSHEFGSIMFRAGEDVGVKLLSRRKEQSSTLGLSLEIIKGTDLPSFPVELLALEFSGYHLGAIRHAHRSEFPELAAGKQGPLSEEVYELLQDMGAMTASVAAKELGRNRASVATLLSGNTLFVRLGRDKDGVRYGIRSHIED